MIACTRSAGFGAITRPAPAAACVDKAGADKPVGTVWIGWKRRGGYTHAERFHFDGDRDAVRRQTVARALEGLEALL